MSQGNCLRSKRGPDHEGVVFRALATSEREGPPRGPRHALYSISRTFCAANLDCVSGSLISRSTIARLIASSALAPSK